MATPIPIPFPTTEAVQILPNTLYSVPTASALAKFLFATNIPCNVVMSKTVDLALPFVEGNVTGSWFDIPVAAKAATLYFQVNGSSSVNLTVQAERATEKPVVVFPTTGVISTNYEYKLTTVVGQMYTVAYTSGDLVNVDVWASNAANAKLGELVQHSGDSGNVQFIATTTQSNLFFAASNTVNISATASLTTGVPFANGVKTFTNAQIISATPLQAGLYAVDFNLKSATTQILTFPVGTSMLGASIFNVSAVNVPVVIPTVGVSTAVAVPVVAGGYTTGRVVVAFPKSTSALTIISAASALTGSATVSYLGYQL